MGLKWFPKVQDTFYYFGLYDFSVHKLCKLTIESLVGNRTLGSSTASLPHFRHLLFIRLRGLLLMLFKCSSSLALPFYCHRATFSLKINQDNNSLLFLGTIPYFKPYMLIPKSLMECLCFPEIVEKIVFFHIFFFIFIATNLLLLYQIENISM